MEINGSPASIVKPVQLSSTISNWQVGQILQATVIKQLSPQSLIIQVAHQQLQADTTVSLTIGQKLELRVSQLSDKPILQARILNPTLPSNVTSHPPVATDAAIKTLLKQALPKQASMATLLANLVWLNQSASKTVPIPAAVLNIAKQLIKQLPTKGSGTNTEQLKYGILNSGVFLESKLSKLARNKATQIAQEKISSSTAIRSTDTLSADLKLNLLRLFTAIQQTTKTDNSVHSQIPMAQTGSQPFIPPSLPGKTPLAQARVQANLAGLSNLPLLLSALGKQVESSLARTQLHQAASLPGDEQAPLNLAFELPIRNHQHIDIFDLIISEDEKNHPNEKNNKQQWNVNLAFDLDGLGPVQVKLKMIDNQVSTTFWTESVATRQLLSQHMENLRQRYHQAGLESSELSCYPGTAPSTVSTRLHIVLDINA